jgi:hypothetical protein
MSEDLKAIAERHVNEGQRVVGRQRELIAKKKALGQDTATAFPPNPKKPTRGPTQYHHRGSRFRSAKPGIYGCFATIASIAALRSTHAPTKH